MKKKYKKLMYNMDWLAVILLIVGGIAWGLIGFFNYNLVLDILPNLSKIIYSAVGVSAVWIIIRSLMKTFMRK